jgi:endonuclease G|tara:strand:+ start:180 stop:398 length:219 start_codon:yes stop_codon:yes gene_type:complete
VSVPDQFYKIIYDVKNQKMFAYLMPNKKIESREKYVVTVDSIEALTGIDFYADLSDDLEDKLEASEEHLINQ